MTEMIDVAIVIAKNANEFERYRIGNPELVPCTVGGHPVLFTHLNSPCIVVVCMYEAIRYVNCDVAWRMRFWKNIEIIMKNTVGYDLSAMVLTHWGNIDYNSGDWNSCASFMADGKPNRLGFKLISSTSKLGKILGLGGDDPICIPRGDSFLSWLDVDQKMEGDL